MSNFVYIAVSIDGFIARPDGSLDWLTGIENPEHTDYGYQEFMDKIDAIVMGRNTFESVEKFDKWPYQKPVAVLSSQLNPGKHHQNGVKIYNVNPKELIPMLWAQGYQNLYIDGGKTIQSFLADNLIDELTITRVPILLGSGIPLFSGHGKEQKFIHMKTTVYKNGLVKSVYRKPEHSLN